ncbi:MAG TPA: nicotinamide riboside transporter PnuC [Methanocorpusculum sp.]|nr:nicotinamide riboside transporter PnuC [Methanocorpusculum sp.]
MNILKYISAYVRFECTGWKKSEIIWLAASILIITAVSLSLGDTLLGIISAAAGITAAVLTGKGKTSGYLLGTVNAALYPIIAFEAAYYGEVILKLLVFIPLNVAGFVLWSKHLDRKKSEVIKRRLKNPQRLCILLILTPAVYLFGLFLTTLGDPEPFIDSFTTILSVAALALTINRFAEQWWLWVAVNVFTIILWGINLASGSANYATLLMWIVYLINSVVMCIRWMKESVAKG